MRLLRLVAALVVLAQGPALAAQELPRLRQYDSATQDSLRSIVAAVAADRLPASAVINKVQEGAARGAPAARVIAVARQVASALGDARRALGAESHENEIIAGATALRAGVPLDALVEVRRERPVGTATTGLVVLTDLVSRGVGVPQAREAMLRVLRADRTDDAVRRLQSSVAHDVPGPDPARAARSVSRFLSALGDPPPATPTKSPPDALEPG